MQKLCTSYRAMNRTVSVGLANLHRVTLAVALDHRGQLATLVIATSSCMQAPCLAIPSIPTVLNHMSNVVNIMHFHIQVSFCCRIKTWCGRFCPVFHVHSTAA
jgi:hypothetical protein